MNIDGMLALNGKELSTILVFRNTPATKDMIEQDEYIEFVKNEYLNDKGNNDLLYVDVEIHGFNQLDAVIQLCKEEGVYCEGLAKEYTMKGIITELNIKAGQFFMGHQEEAAKTCRDLAEMFKKDLKDKT